VLALVAGQDWLGEAAEVVPQNHRDELWASQCTLVEHPLVSVREDRDAENASSRTLKPSSMCVETSTRSSRRRATPKVTKPSV
jgi:hypothetical protein